ncbi:hypothetical protein ACHAWF_012340 [Thalassiosira exigua]
MTNPPRRLGLVGAGRRRPLLVGTAALSLLASALPSAAFAASAAGGERRSPHSGSAPSLRPPRRGRHPRPPLPPPRGGGRSSSSGEEEEEESEEEERATTKPRSSYARAPPAPAASPLARPVRKVVVVGGTHGNEYTGVWCIKAIERQRELFFGGEGKGEGKAGAPSSAANVFERYPSLDIGTLLANPVAHLENKRFVDVDLNREFSREKLLRVPIDEGDEEEGFPPEGCDVRTEFCSDGRRAADLPHEARRAREIESLLGPKFAPPASSSSEGDAVRAESNTDVVIDLHTTTANMGISLIVPEGDPLVAAAAAYVLHECRRKYGEDGAQCLVHAMPRRRDRVNLSSCGRHGFTIEVGPTPQGVLRHDVVEKTEAALHALLEFLHLRNRELEGAEGDDDDDDDDKPAPSSSSSSAILDRLGEIYPAGAVPCYRSAPATRPGELSGKIGWPNCPTNPNFPQRMVHKSLQDRDFRPLKKGDPLFVELDGTIVPYDGSHGDEVHLIFVNEGGYYYASSGTGIGVAVKSRFDWRTGWFVVESDDEEGATEEVVVEEKDSYE